MQGRSTRYLCGTHYSCRTGAGAQPTGGEASARSVWRAMEYARRERARSTPVGCDQNTLLVMAAAAQYLSHDEVDARTCGINEDGDRVAEAPQWAIAALGEATRQAGIRIEARGGRCSLLSVLPNRKQRARRPDIRDRSLQAQTVAEQVIPG